VQSELEYPSDNGQDGRLSCWLRGEGTWAVAHVDSIPAGIVCLVALDDGPGCGQLCLYWLEVLRAFRNQGVGQALLRWSVSQIGDWPLLIQATSAAASFYRHHLTLAFDEVESNTFVVLRGGDTVRSTQRRAA
jgi:GNAT superfamily N-acetyltransferase